MSKHTPGPWKCIPQLDTEINEGAENSYVGDSDAAYFLDFPNQIAHSDTSEVEANARLIAAAPELLELCEHSLALFKDLNKFSDVYTDEIEALTKLISKVEDK